MGQLRQSREGDYINREVHESRLLNTTNIRREIQIAKKERKKMGIAAFEWGNKKLTLLQNRDNFDSWTINGAAWDGDNQILSGRLEPDGGTWFGISRRGRVAFLVDRMLFSVSTNCSSSLPMCFLQLDMSPEEFARQLAQGNMLNAETMAYNLIVADITLNSMFHISRQHADARSPVATAAVGFGVHVLSLGRLDANFSQDLRMKRLFTEMIGDYEDKEVPPLKEISAKFMYDPVENTEGNKLSAFFVDMKVRNVTNPERYREERRYRTTSTTALTVKPIMEVNFYERYLEDGAWKHHDFTFNIA